MNIEITRVLREAVEDFKTTKVYERKPRSYLRTVQGDHDPSQVIRFLHRMISGRYVASAYKLAGGRL